MRQQAHGSFLSIGIRPSALAGYAAFFHFPGGLVRRRPHQPREALTAGNGQRGWPHATRLRGPSNPVYPQSPPVPCPATGRIRGRATGRRCKPSVAKVRFPALFITRSLRDSRFPLAPFPRAQPGSRGIRGHKTVQAERFGANRRFTSVTLLACSPVAKKVVAVTTYKPPPVRAPSKTYANRLSLNTYAYIAPPVRAPSNLREPAVAKRLRL